MSSRSSWLIALADPLSVRGRSDELPRSLPANRQHLEAGIAQLIRGDTAPSRRTFDDDYGAAEKARDGERAMVRFHQNMRDGLGIGKALQLAEIWLSGLSVSDLAAEEQKLAGAHAERVGLLHEVGQAEQLRDLGSARVQPTGPIHPRQWAPFVVIGM